MYFNFFIIALIIINIILFFYVNHKILKDWNFVDKIIKSSIFSRDKQNYTGFVICAERDTLHNRLNLIRRISAILSEHEECVLVDVSNIDENKTPDVEFIKKFHIRVIPTILKLNNGIKQKDLVNFLDSNVTSDEEIIKIVKNSI